MTIEQKQILSELNKTQHGAALKLFLNEQLDLLDSCSDIPDDADYAVEAKGRKEAVKILERLFSFMEGVSHSKNQRNQYL